MAERYAVHPKRGTNVSQDYLPFAARFFLQNIRKLRDGSNFDY